MKKKISVLIGPLAIVIGGITVYGILKRKKKQQTVMNHTIKFVNITGT